MGIYYGEPIGIGYHYKKTPDAPVELAYFYEPTVKLSDITDLYYLSNKSKQENLVADWEQRAHTFLENAINALGYELVGTTKVVTASSTYGPGIFYMHLYTPVKVDPELV
jgi:hypothetical protein